MGTGSIATMRGTAMGMGNTAMGMGSIATMRNMPMNMGQTVHAAAMGTGMGITITMQMKYLQAGGRKRPIYLPKKPLGMPWKYSAVRKNMAQFSGQKGWFPRRMAHGFILTWWTGNMNCAPGSRIIREGSASLGRI